MVKKILTVLVLAFAYMCCHLVLFKGYDSFDGCRIYSSEADRKQTEMKLLFIDIVREERDSLGLSKEQCDSLFDELHKWKSYQEIDTGIIVFPWLYKKILKEQDELKKLYGDNWIGKWIEIRRERGSNLLKWL